MACERNRIINLIKYIESFGIEVNNGKNKAQGNKGFFKAKNKHYRIDIAKGLSEENIIKTLAHEFAHFVHYKHDKYLKSLDFIFEETDILTEEMISITVSMIPSESIKPLFEIQNNIKNDINIIKKDLKKYLPDFSYSKHAKQLEKAIKKTSLKHLLKYDKVKVIEGFSYRIYSVEDLEYNNENELFIKLLSKKRALKRISSKISRLNKYYNTPTELFARSFELYATNKTKIKEIAPNIYKQFENCQITELSNFVKKIQD